MWDQVGAINLAAPDPYVFFGTFCSPRVTIHIYGGIRLRKSQCTSLIQIHPNRQLLLLRGGGGATVTRQIPPCHNTLACQSHVVRMIAAYVKLVSV